MAEISEFLQEDEKELPELQAPPATDPSSSSSPPPPPPPAFSSDEEEALASMLAKKGPLPFLEAAVELVRTKTEFFIDNAAVSKVMSVVSAAHYNFTVNETLKKVALESLMAPFLSAEEQKKDPELEKMMVDKAKEKEAEETVKPDEADVKDNLRTPNCGNGLDLDQHSWTQTMQQVDILVPVPWGTKKSNLVCQITMTHLKVGFKGQPPIIDGDLYQSVRTEDCFWTIEDEKAISILLTKNNQEFWTCLVKGEPEIDTQKAKPVAGSYSDLDPGTQQFLQKLECQCHYDELQRATDLPTSDEKQRQEATKKLKHLEMDFSKAKFL